MGHHTTEELIPLNIAVLTVSDTRNFDNDTSGQTLIARLEDVGHNLADRKLVTDDIYQIRSELSQWIASENIHAVLVTGGTGFTSRDSTPEAVTPLLDKTVDGFGELFRKVSYDLIGTSTLQSRAFAGMANKTIIFCVPGSTGACKDAWDHIINSQLDSRQGPCNFVPQLKNIDFSACVSRA